MKYRKRDFAAAALGVCLLAIGLVLVKAIADPRGIMRTLPYICVGVGTGMFGHGTDSLLRQRAFHNNPELQKQDEINKTDERNVAIVNRAKARAYDMMVSVFGALLLTLALIGVDLAAVLLLVFAYLLVMGYGLYWRIRYDREM